MKKLTILALTALMIFSPIQKAKSAEIAGTLVVAAAASAYLYFITTIAPSKAAAIDHAQNDVQNYLATGVATLELENSIKNIQSLDSNISEAEAIDMILEAVSEL